MTFQVISLIRDLKEASNDDGDQLTLYAAANLYNVNIHIISPLGAGASHVFHPGLDVPPTTLFLSWTFCGKPR